MIYIFYYCKFILYKEDNTFIDNYFENIIKLRPHHINCIFFYQGLGYDEKFTKHMNQLVSSIKSKPYVKIRFILECDTLCSKCPNKQKNKCTSEEHIKILDKNTIDNYDLNINSYHTFNEIINNIYKNYNVKKFNKICSSCTWYKQGICSNDVIKNQKRIWNI